MYGGKWEYINQTCAVTPPKPREEEKPQDECVAAGGGKTYCVLKNGDFCATATTGRSFCWKPAEEGKKTDGPITQEVKPGVQPPTPPPGSENVDQKIIEKTSESVTTSTTISTYTTTSGQPAGTKNEGKATDQNGKPISGGSGGTGTGTGTGAGDGDEDGNESGGGGDCQAPPVSSGDPLLAQIASQAWATRCAIEDRNKAQDDQAANLAAESDGYEEINVSDIYSTNTFEGINEGLLGGSAGMCSFGVELSLLGEPIELPGAFWELASWIGMLIVAMAYLWLAHQLGG